jgi:signal transduction histidine kinase
MLITMFVLTGLQVHLSRFSFLLCMTPFMVGLSLITGFGAHSPAPDMWAAGIFCVAVIAASWRQQVSDEASAVSAAALTRQNESLQTALASAERANRAKADFLAVTSHEVRTPLNAVLGMAGVLAREATSERQRTLAQGIELSGNVLLRLLNGILDFAKQEAGKAQLDLAPVAVADVLSTLHAVWASKCEEGGVALYVGATEGVDGLVGAADPGKLEQTLMNLVSNAIKLTPSGGEVVVSAGMRDLDDGRVSLRFEIGDRGPGVAESERARIFQPYEQAEAGRAAGGTGLGLAICCGNLKLFGGEIGVEDRAGGGSIFWFEFPAERAQPAEEAAPEAGETVGLEGVRILAADDHPTNREVLKLLITPLGAALDIVENGALAVEAVTSGAPYDLILMDAQMPVMDGETAVRCIRDMETPGSRTPIVMVTANVFPEDVARYHAAGCDAVLGKPIDMAQLHACMARMLFGEETDGEEAAAA